MYKSCAVQSASRPPSVGVLQAEERQLNAKQAQLLNKTPIYTGAKKSYMQRECSQSGSGGWVFYYAFFAPFLFYAQYVLWLRR